MKKIAILSLLLFMPFIFANGDEGREVEVAPWLALGIAIGFALGALSTYAYFLRSQKEKLEGSGEVKPVAGEAKLNIPGLTESEEKLLRIVVSSGGRISQDRLPALAGMSKARVSEVLSTLEKRGIVRKEVKGRTNEIIFQNQMETNHIER